MKTKEQLQNQFPTISMTSEFSIHELNCAIRQLNKQTDNNNKNATGKDGGVECTVNRCFQHHLEKMVFQQKLKLKHLKLIISTAERNAGPLILRYLQLGDLQTQSH